MPYPAQGLAVGYGYPAQGPAVPYAYPEQAPGMSEPVASVRGIYVDPTGLKKLVPAFAKHIASSYLAIVVIATLLLLANIWIGYFAFSSVSSRYESGDELLAAALIPVVGFTVVVLIVSTAACLLVVIPMRRGLPWARVLGTVIVSLVILVSFAVVITMVAAAGIRVGILWIVLLATSIGWIINAWSGKVPEPKKRKRRGTGAA
ncbi:magnesium-transporting ATPase (P-type) [Mycetocola sp. BIGb0189]|uniref:hypothetical protein n=1 Tax=Mycetocola sp. BIGb0189 TaxID=2940604 RepID=UPI002168C9C2|nr:hypothetical protein [Mycetocola sp. BIGb0189]MCS4277689.1 magnesium-transporting ATPase (P-type) [Mycetocola sp. BIGb0189]